MPEILTIFIIYIIMYICISLKMKIPCFAKNDFFYVFFPPGII